MHRKKILVLSFNFPVTYNVSSRLAEILLDFL